MNITFYKNTDEVASFPKNLSDGYWVTGTLRSECDVLNPIIEFSGFNPALEYNYAYIEEFRRYYFITSSNAVRENITEITFHVDVLQTYANELLNHKAFINRATNVKNPYIIDDYAPLKPDYERSYIQILGDSGDKTLRKPTVSASATDETAMRVIITAAGTPHKE